MSCGLISCGSIAAQAQTAKRAITFDDMIQMHRVGEPEISPDGKWIAYTLSTPDMDANRNASNLWVVATSGGASMQLTRGVFVFA
jgi:dipeptidyl aminopeptidase/acylaminoacyl peptidase